MKTLNALPPIATPDDPKATTGDTGDPLVRCPNVLYPNGMNFWLAPGLVNMQKAIENGH